ncbi:hypothetical protein MGALJ_60790 (plasmid) [Mycobacterium gallinarum]|uniref:DUF2637 domain-containing protein n=1 Tax=Mycobacterium gallinarum TaxID=39689 RepID=A0A9W4BEG7_9MYCO|nr:DUF2637 domain-containing protein [Mycobacterium gallinarum]BBY96410.1 hypothetical protein MGALJ_60790 [Mycobacterium gallinarum]
MTALITDAARDASGSAEPLVEVATSRPFPTPRETTAVDMSAAQPARDRRAQQAARLSLVRMTRATAVGITVLIAALSFVLSFSSLADLAARTVWPGRLAWLWPVIVDGTIVLATMALVAFSAYPEQRGPRRYFWALLGAGAAVSVAGNAVHAMLPNANLPDQPLGSWGAAAIACVPPIALVLVTHALSILWRFTPYERPDERAQRQDEALALAAERLERWDAVAAAIHERGQMLSHPTAKIADALRMLHDTQPSLPLRQIGQQLGLRHDAVARIRDAAKAVLDERTDEHQALDGARPAAKPSVAATQGHQAPRG